jgi:aryl-alcohol dehydrogenase-like predicted oxidoreductase
MQHRNLGRSAIQVPPVIFGCNVFGWTVDKAQSFRLLDQLLDVGLNALDTADVYSVWVPGNAGGESEAIIGEWLAARGNRSRVTLLTKVGMQMGPRQAQGAHPDYVGKVGLSRRWIMASVEDSLRRLRTDVIDVYQAHRDDPETPLEETLDAFAALIKAGKIRAIGASNYTAPRLQAALAASAKHGLPRYETMQPHYNLMERSEFEAALGPLCRAEGLSVIPYYALAAGFLTGKYRSAADFAKTPRGPGLAKYLDARGERVLAALDATAAEQHATPGQVALAWISAKLPNGAPIASATTAPHVAELAKAATLALSTAQLARLDAASA